MEISLETGSNRNKNVTGEEFSREDGSRGEDFCPPALEQFVYFIRCVGAGFIKIGYCDAKHGPLKRLSALQCASPFELELLGVVKGAPGLESRLHKRFAHLRGRGEWFAEAPELMRYIRQSTPVETRGVAAYNRRGSQKAVFFEGSWKLAWSGRHYHFCEPSEDRALCKMLCDQAGRHAAVKRCPDCERRLAKQIEKIRARFVKVGLAVPAPSPMPAQQKEAAR